MSLITTMQGLMSVSVSGGGLPPTAYGNLTLWYDADVSTLYKTGSDTGGVATANNDNVARVDSAASINRVMFDLAAKLRLAYFGSNRAIHYTNTDHKAFAKPAAASTPSTTVQMSTLVSASNAVIIFAGQVDATAVDSGIAYLNQGLIAEQSGYIGLHIYQSGGTITFQAYNFASSEVVVTTTAPAGTPVVITLKHTGGQLRIRKNGVEIASAASGNTGGFGHAYIGATSTEMHVNSFCTYNAARTDAEILEVEKYFGAKVGITI